MVASVFAPAGAQTVAQLQAQIAALMAQLNALQGATSGASITSDLTVGSTGAQVVTLQQALVSGGYLVMPQGVAMGYFGPLTKEAVMKWQAASGISATGYFGPLSRAKFGSVATAPGTTPAAPGAITTPGVEGTLTVTTAPVSNSTVYEGQSMRDVLAFKAQAKMSDMSIQRVRIDLGTATTFYRDVASMIYLVDDAGRTVASSALNNNTVVKNGNNYEITLAGFSSVVAKDTSRVYTVKVDVQNSIDAAKRTNYTVRLAASGVRAIDGAGIDGYSPANATDVSKSIAVSASLIDSASLLVSPSVSNPEAREIVAALGSSENEADKVVLAVFDIRADKDAIEITDLNNISVTAAGTASASTTYLYAGNGTSGQLISSAALAAGTASFTNISYTIPAGTTRTFTLAADIRGATTTATTFTSALTVNATNVVGENSIGDTVTAVSGSFTGNSLITRSVGPEITLGSKSLVRNPGTSATANGTSTAEATFNITLKAVGGDIWFGTQAASTTFGFGIHSNGANAAALGATQATSWAIPSGVVTTGLAGGQAFKLSEGSSVTIPVTFIFDGRLTTGALVPTAAYAVGLSSVAWNDAQLGTAESSTFMANKTEWRTNAVTMP